MKSKPSVLWLIVGGIALVIWLAWPSTKDAPTNQQSGPRTDAASLPLAAPTPPGVNGNQGSSPLTTPSPGAMKPLDSGLTTGSPAASQAAGAAASFPTSAEPGAANQITQVDVGRVRHMIGDYHTLMGENPVGTNAEIMKQMTGGNPKQAVLGPPEGMSLNAQGELVDQWGSPYFFHQMSRDKMEVRSAGPDKVMWTADDVIAR